MADRPGAVADKRTEVAEGESVTGMLEKFLSVSSEGYGGCTEAAGAAVAAQYHDMLREYADKGARIRFIVEVTKDNLSDVKKMREIADVRHLDSVKGNFMVSKNAYLASAILQGTREHAIYSTAKGIVEQNWYIFETLWSSAIPAEQKVKEIEEGILPAQTKVLEEPGEVYSRLAELHETSNEVMVASTAGALQLVHNQFFDTYKRLMAKRAKGEHKGIRWVMFIDEDGIDIVKTFLDIGMEIRHVKNMPTMYFTLSDKIYNATIETLAGGKMVQTLLTSTEPAYVRHFKSVFEGLWKSGIDARDRIRDIELGVNEGTELILSPYATERVYKNIVSGARTEIMLILPTENAFARAKKIGIIDLLKEASSSRKAKVRMLVSAKEGQCKQDIADLESSGALVNQVSFKPPQKDREEEAATIIEEADLAATTLIVDNRAALVIQLRNDKGENFVDAAGAAVLSTGRALVSSYARIFESLWRETSLAAQLRESDKMQREFINVAAHELKTPIQPILITAYLLGADELEGANEEEEIPVKRKYLSIIFRNAKRLQQLSSNILEVARLESHAFRLKKQRINLSDVIRGEIHSAQSKNREIEWQYEPKDVFLEADELRIGEVMANLLGNAARFAEKGVVSVTVERNEGNGETIVSVSDTGAGIDMEIMPKLFQKFASKSDVNTGTGLGLYISKNIIEAHGGRIWAENNKKGGATFSFALPAA